MLCVWGGKTTAGLDDGVLIKDNHIEIAGSVEKAVKLAKSCRSHGESRSGSRKSCTGQGGSGRGADVIMLDMTRAMKKL